VAVSAPEGIPFRCASFEGHVLFLNRPHPEPKGDGWPYAKHFVGKARRFELRLQGRFLSDPGSAEDVFFGIELTKVVGMSWALRSTANWIMSVVSLLCAARGVSYSYSLDIAHLPDGDVLRPHLAFPLVAADVVAATPSGEQPPPLSEPRNPMTMAQRQAVRLNCTDTFTFAYWSKQADFAAWKICNMPMGWSASFSSFIGSQSVHMTTYRLKRSVAEGGLHTERNKRCLCRLVLSNSCVAGATVPAAVTDEKAVGAGAADKPEPRAAPVSLRPLDHMRPRPWCLEEAELPLEELDRLWTNRHFTGSYTKDAEEPQPRRPSWLSSVACCSATARHGIR